MAPKKTVLLKRDDPVWAELIGDIEAVMSGRYAEDPDVIFGPEYVPSEAEPGFEFGVLTRKDRQNLLADMVDWRGYGSRGMSHDQQGIVIANVLDETPKEQWLDGVFDEAVLENARITSFKMLVEDMKNSPTGHHFEEMNGDWRPWDDLSAGAKLQYIVRDAVICDVPLQSFAEVVKNTIGDRVDAALRVVLEGQQELHAIAKLFPDDGRTEPTPLVEQVKDLLDYVLVLETQEKERLNGREELSQGISNTPEAKPGQGRSEGVEALREMLREDSPLPDGITGQRLDAILNGPRQSPHPSSASKLSLPDAADFWWCQGLTPPWVAEDKEGHQNTEPKEDRISLADLRDKALGQQPEKQTTKDKGLER